MTTQSPPAESSQTERTESDGSPASRPINTIALGRIRFNPPPLVPAQRFPSRSSPKHSISSCEVGTFSKIPDSKRNKPSLAVPIQSAPERSFNMILGAAFPGSRPTCTSSPPPLNLSTLGPAQIHNPDVAAPHISTGVSSKASTSLSTPSRHTPSSPPCEYQTSPA